MSLGGDEPADDGEEEESTCNIDLVSSESVFALDQAAVEALSGCREVPGSLYIRVPVAQQQTFTLTPLADLEAVRGVLSIVGSLTSLAGLESLKEVASLEFEYLHVSDLEPLRNLDSVQRVLGDARSNGTISLIECDQLTDLRGLENLTSWNSLNLVDLDSLVTLDGLQAPPRLDTISISSVPQLADVSALAPVHEVGTFGLYRTAVESLDGFELESAQVVSFGANHALTDLDGLSRLRTAKNLSISDNDALLRIELPVLSDFMTISIVDNAVLRAVPHYQAGSGQWSQPFAGVDNDYGRFSRVLFEVADNPQLETIVLPTDYTDIDQVALYRNPSLTSLDMGNLLRSDNIWIQDNAVLDTIAAPSLARVDELSVKNNPALSVAPFASVQTFTRDVTGNLDELTP